MTGSDFHRSGIITLVDNKSIEKEFHNKRFSGRDLRSAFKPFFHAVYSSVAGGARRDYFDRVIAASTAESAVLEYGCGIPSDFTFRLARQSRKVAGIDISDAAIDKARLRAAEEGLSEKIEFFCMDAENLTFDDSEFDVVFGSGIIHHLNVASSLDTIIRVLKPGGKAFFFEPLGHNPFVRLFRLLTPQFRTPNEHPLMMKDFDTMRKYVDTVSVSYYCLLALFFTPLAFVPFLRPVIGWVNRLDAVLFRRVPFLRRYAWLSVIELSK